MRKKKETAEAQTCQWLAAVLLMLCLLAGSVIYVSADTSLAPKDLTRSARLQGTVALQVGNYAAAVEGVLSKIDKDNNAVVPYIENSRTYVPLRFIAEKLDAQVTWDGKLRQVTIVKDGKTILVPVGADYYMLDGVKHPLDAPPQIIGDRTFLPVRFVAEALDNSVYWDGEFQMVIISPADVPWTGKTTEEQQLRSDFLLIMSPLLRDFQE